MSFNNRAGHSRSNNNSYSASLDGKRINSSVTDYLSDNSGEGLNTNIFLSRTLNSKGRGITFGFSYNANNFRNTSDNIGINIFQLAGLPVTDSLNQRSNDVNTGSALNMNTSWIEPISKSINFLIRIAYSKANNVSERATYSLNPVSGEYEFADSLLSNNFRNNNESFTPGISLNYNSEKLHGAIGNSISYLTQENFSVNKGDVMHQRYVNFFPVASLVYQVNKTSHVNIGYNGRSQQPSIQQLQPVTDNRNPLYIRLGNPDLLPSFIHTVNLNMNAQKIEKQIFIYGGFNYTATANQIVQEVYYDSLGRQISRPVNTNGNNNGSLYLSYGKNWKRKTWSLKTTWNSSINLGKNTVISNRIKNRANSYGFSQTLSVNYEKNEKFDIGSRYVIRYNDTRYSIEQKGQVSSSITQSVSVDVNINLTKRLILETDINTNYNSRIAPGFRKSVTSWSAAINLKLFKKEQGNLRFVIYDILKENTNVYRYISQTFIEDVETEVLQQYFLVSFTYNLRKFGRGR